MYYKRIDIKLAKFLNRKFLRKLIKKYIKEIVIQ